MKAQQLLRGWWAYLPAIAIAIAVGVCRHWDTFSLVLVAGIVLVSCVRFLLPLFRGSVARKMARMSPETRERLLSHCDPEERRKLEKEIDDQAA
jgi:hypothetical protein